MLEMLEKLRENKENLKIYCVDYGTTEASKDKFSEMERDKSMAERLKAKLTTDPDAKGVIVYCGSGHSVNKHKSTGKRREKFGALIKEELGNTLHVILKGNSGTYYNLGVKKQEQLFDEENNQIVFAEKVNVDNHDAGFLFKKINASKPVLK